MLTNTIGGKSYEIDYRTFLKVQNGFIAFVFQRAIPIPHGDSPFAKPAPALRSLPSVALSSGAVKAFRLEHKHYFLERIA